jgi:3'(2'), 5'-bisphosphate nucleotidase
VHPITYAPEAAAAARIASQAGRRLLEIKAELTASGVEAAVLGAQGDRQAHELIMAALAAAFPQDAVLSEEAADDRARLHRSRVWIVDPLDGTREFQEQRDDWAVHVALCVDGWPVAAAVALPARGRIFTTSPPESMAPKRRTRPRMVVSRTRAPEVATTVAAALGADVVPMGSAGAKAMAVVSGDADIYVHSGGQYEWDSAAPVGVAAAAGLHVSRLDGSQLRYNQADVWLPDQLICLPELAASALEAVAGR